MLELLELTTEQYRVLPVLCNIKRVSTTSFSFSISISISVSPGIYAPTISGQEQAIRRAYERAKVDPATVTLVEGHGTGTPVGDAVELTALKNVLGEVSQTLPKRNENERRSSRHKRRSRSRSSSSSRSRSSSSDCGCSFQSHINAHVHLNNCALFTAFVPLLGPREELGSSSSARCCRFHQVQHWSPQGRGGLRWSNQGISFTSVISVYV